MNLTVCNIPMALIPHPQGPWLEGINPVTNRQWQNGVEPLIGQGAKYCLLEPHYRGDLMARHFGDLKDVLDTFGRDYIPKDWDGIPIERWIDGKLALALFQWFPKMSPSGFDGDHQPVVDVSFHHAKGWTLCQGGLYLLTQVQWEWSARGGDKQLAYATETGELTDTDGRKLAHCSVGTEEYSTIDVNDPRYADGPFGLRHKTGNVCEWVDANWKIEDGKTHINSDLRGGSWSHDDPEDLLVSFNFDDFAADFIGNNFGFRVGAPLPQKLK